MPLLQRAYAMWAELQAESGRDLLTLCGGIYVGDPASSVFTGARASAELHGLDHEVLTAEEIRARFPTLRPPDHAMGLYESNAGFTRPEQTVLANIDLARRHGAELHFEESVLEWSATPDGGVEVVTGPGATALARSSCVPAPGLPGCCRTMRFPSPSSVRSSTG